MAYLYKSWRSNNL